MYSNKTWLSFHKKNHSLRFNIFQASLANKFPPSSLPRITLSHLKRGRNFKIDSSAQPPQSSPCSPIDFSHPFLTPKGRYLDVKNASIILVKSHTKTQWQSHRLNGRTAATQFIFCGFRVLLYDFSSVMGIKGKKAGNEWMTFTFHGDYGFVFVKASNEINLRNCSLMVKFWTVTTSGIRKKW